MKFCLIGYGFSCSFHSNMKIEEFSGSCSILHDFSESINHLQGALKIGFRFKKGWVFEFFFSILKFLLQLKFFATDPPYFIWRMYSEWQWTICNAINYSCVVTFYWWCLLNWEINKKIVLAFICSNLISVWSFLYLVWKLKIYASNWRFFLLFVLFPWS